MSKQQFSQPTIVNALCVTLARICNDAPSLSEEVLADEIAMHFPHVPLSAIRVLASRVLKLYFDLPSLIEEIGNAGLGAEEEAEASRFFGDVAKAQANLLRAEIDRRHGPQSNVVGIDKAGSPDA